MNTGYFTTRFRFDPCREVVWKAICEDLQKFVAQQGTVLDLGAGYCSFINNIRSEKKVAVDINPECGQFCAQDVAFHAAETHHIPFLSAGSVQTVFLSNVLEHLNEEKIILTLQEIYRVSTQGATVVVIGPNYRYAYKEYFDDFTHQRAFSHVSLTDLFCANRFVPVRIFPRYLPLTMNSILPKSYWLTKLYLSLPFKPFGKQMLAVFKKEPVPNV